MKAFIRSTIRAVYDFIEHDCMSSAAAIAYYSIFALPPLLVIVFMLATAAGVTQEQVERAVTTQIGIPTAGEKPADGDSTRELKPDSGLSALANREKLALGRFSAMERIAGAAILVFTATGLFAQLQYALNRVWEVQPDPKQSVVRHFLMKRLLSLGMIIVIAFLLLVSLVISAAISQIVALVQGAAPGPVSQAVGQGMDTLVTLGLGTLLFAAMFHVLPDAKLAWRDMWLGAAVTALLFIAGKSVIGWYLQQTHVGASWGDAASSIVAILVWLYYTSLIVLFGAELTQVWSKRLGHGAPPVEGAVQAVQKTHIKRQDD